MGINPTPTNHRSFTFDGKSTREFGVYITGEGVFNAPERAVEMISIPGRDGEYALDQGHFNNIEVTYRAGIVADSTTDFAEAISNFRNWLASREGYCRLTDEYNTEEYRMAVFKNAIALEHEGLLTGEFDVTFDCKPQRFLAIGEELTEIGAWGNTETAEGDIVTIEASSDTAVKALTADIEPIQDLNGYDAPWVGGAGKNKCDASSTWSVNSSGLIVEPSANTKWFFPSSLVGQQVTISVKNKANATNSNCRIRAVIGGTNNDSNYGNKTNEFNLLYVTVTPQSTSDCFLFDSSGGNGTYKEVQVEIGSSATDFAPYENICPISGHDEVDVEHTGKNLWYTDFTNTNVSTGLNIVKRNGEMVVDAEYGASTTYLLGGNTEFINYRLKKGTYTLSAYSDTFSGIYVTLSDNTTWANGETKTFANDVIINNVRCSQAHFEDNTHATYYWQLQLELGTTATEYESYKGNTYTTTLPSTTYGGTVDVVSGTLKPAPYYASYNGEALEGEWVSDRDKYVAGTTPTTGAQVVNIGKVGTATQLTGQSIELLEGENNIFADSGNVTVEYGHNPTLLTNPTWFPSKPLLAVEGYGLLKLGKSEIDLDNVPVGDITLLDDGRFKLTQTAANTYSVTFTIDEGALNVGDDITASINALPFRFYIVGDGVGIQPSSYTVADTNSDFVSSLSLGYGGSSADFSGETVINVKFDSGTSSTITNTVSGDLVVKKTNPTPTSNITLTYSITETVDYDASLHTITLTETATITYSSSYISSAQLRTTSLGASALITAYSTISIIQDEVFIDCDIGEAYTIKDGEPISLNQHIDLGSDLPTLPSGDTEVTYDNTITKVEVKPNWWKV